MSFDDIVTTGLAALFGGTLIWAPIGVLVGRSQGFSVGFATGMILFGLTGLVFAAWLAWLLWGPGADLEIGTKQIGIVGVFGAFGGFGALGGATVIASELEKRRPQKPVPRRHTGLYVALTAAGNVVLLGGVLTMAFAGDGGHAAMFRSVVIACACFFAATLFKGGSKLFHLLFFVLLGGGFYLAAQSLRLFGGES